MGYYKSEFNHGNLYDRVQKLLVSNEWSDCCFLVSGQCFKAHKLIMAISSPVFEAMFYGPLSTNEEIKITDIEPDIFHLLLNYIYTDKVEIMSIENAFELLYASRKYMLEHLSDICITYVQSNLSIDNVTTILNYPEHMQDDEVLLSSLRLFCEHATFLLEESKKSISLSCMFNILANDQMNITEKNLIKHVFEWTAYYCEQNHVQNTVDNRRDILINNDLFKLLRFYTLSLDEVDEIFTDTSNLLLPKEIENIKKLIQFKSSDNDTKFSLPDSASMQRKQIKHRWHLCHRSPLRSVAPILIDSRNYVIHSRIKASKSMFITALCIPTRMAPVLHFRNNETKMYSEQISVSLKCESDNNVIKFTNFMNTVEYDSMIDIQLSEPCLIRKDKWYLITFRWPENRSHTYSYVVEYRDRIYKDQKIILEFEDSPTSGTSGSFLSGVKFCM